jgi:O-antigen/teichoic acid export membrane protein
MTKAGVFTASAQLWRTASGSELRRNVLESYGTRVLVVAVSFATAIVIARVLGPAGRGMYAVAVALGAIGTQFGNLGLHASNTYYVAKDRDLLPALIGNTLAVVVAVSGITALGGIAFFLWPRLAPIHDVLLLLALASIPAGLAYLLSQGLLLGVNEVRTYNWIEFGGKLFALGLICVAGLIHGGSVELFFAITLWSTLVSFLWALQRLRRVATAPPVLSWVVFRQTIGIGMKAYLIAFFGFLLLRIDLLMVKYMLGAVQAGYYSISQVLSENAMMFPVVVGMLLFPKLSATKEREEKLQVATKAVLVTAALMLPVVVIAAFVAAPVIQITFGRNFLPAVGPFVWLLPGIYFLGIETVLVQLLNSEGFPPVIVVGWVVATLVNISLNFWAIPHYGIAGASITSSVCYTLMFVIIAVVVWRRHYLAPV